MLDSLAVLQKSAVRRDCVQRTPAGSLENPRNWIFGNRLVWQGREVPMLNAASLSSAKTSFVHRMIHTVCAQAPRIWGAAIVEHAVTFWSATPSFAQTTPNGSQSRVLWWEALKSSAARSSHVTNTSAAKTLLGYWWIQESVWAALTRNVVRQKVARIGSAAIQPNGYTELSRMPWRIQTEKVGLTMNAATSWFVCLRHVTRQPNGSRNRMMAPCKAALLSSAVTQFSVVSLFATQTATRQARAHSGTRRWTRIPTSGKAAQMKSAVCLCTAVSTPLPTTPDGSARRIQAFWAAQMWSATIRVCVQIIAAQGKARC